MTGDFPDCIWCGHRGEREVDFLDHKLILCDRHSDHLRKVLGGTGSEADFMVKALARIVERRAARSDRIDG